MGYPSHIMNAPARQTPVRVATELRTRGNGLSDRIGQALEETRRLEDEIRLLEEALGPLQARLDAAVRPLVEAVIQARRDLVVLVERRIRSAGPRDRRLMRDATELLHHLASDLQERFGIVVRAVAEAREDDDPDEEDGSWDHESWTRPEPSPDRPGPAPRPARRPLVDPESAARGIYRNLARELHPDKTRDAAERDRRTSLMQDLTSAWRDRDFPALLGLLHLHGSDAVKSDSLDEPTLKATLQGVEETRDRLRLRQRNLRHQGLPGGVVDWMPLVRDPKLFEKVLRREKRVPREELEQMLRIKALFARPGGLEEFLDEVPWQDWPAVL